LNQEEDELAAWWDPYDQQEDEEANDQDGFLPSQQPDSFKRAPAVTNQIQELARKLNMATDVKKAVLQAIVTADDYLQAFENCQRLNLKKQQQREAIKVIVQLCISDRKKFNPFYYLLAQRLIKENPQSYRYSFKYTLWDYLKALDKFDIQQIKNLAKITGCLIRSLAIPLHFLKVVDFLEDSNKHAE